MAGHKTTYNSACYEFVLIYPPDDIFPIPITFCTKQTHSTIQTTSCITITDALRFLYFGVWEGFFFRLMSTTNAWMMSRIEELAWHSVRLASYSFFTYNPIHSISKLNLAPIFPMLKCI